MDAALLRCPRCTASLDATWTCVGCGALHPAPGGVPCVLHDAEDVRDRFATRFADALRESDEQRLAIDDALAHDRLGPASVARLRAFADAVQLSARTIADIAARAGLAFAPPPKPRTMVPSVAGHAPLFEHYEYLFRDWGWSDHAHAEHELALARIIEAAHGIERPRLLVLGAGASRLAHDLHHRLAATHTLALDINPLLVLTAAELLEGRTLELAEFPANHLAAPEAVTIRRLACPVVPVPGPVLAFADATRPPITPMSFDLVVTPWFLDQLHQDLRDILPGIHGALTDHGRWIFHGPLLHPRGKPLARCITTPELLEQLPASGFDVTSHRRDVHPYLRSPEGSARTEPVLTLAAHPRPGMHHDLPPWLRGIALPIPRAELPRSAADPIASAIGPLVDGTRSVLDIAALLARRGGVDRRLALDVTLAGLHTLRRAAAQ